MNKNKKSLLLIIIPIVFITLGLVIAGAIFQTADYEKQQGLTSVFDVAIDETIAYVTYLDGKAGIRFRHAEKTFDKSILLSDVDKKINDVTFSPDGSSIAYIIADKDPQSNLNSTVRLFTMATGEDKELFSTDTLITEIVFNPQDEKMLFYLKAGTFENYSPIASAHPHEFDLYSYHLTDQTHQQYTNLRKYSMQSLNISPSGSIAFIQMPDDDHVETADDVFAMNQRVFQIPLDSPEELAVVSAKNREKDIYDFAIIGDRHEMVFQAVSKTGENGIFEYELFYYNWDNDEEKQLTTLKEHAGNPVIGPHQDKIYFIVDRKFGKRHADLHLYEMELDGKNLKEISLEIGEN